MRRHAALIAVCVAGCAGWDARPLVTANPPLAAPDLAVVDPPAREPAGTLSPREIHRDLLVLMFALRAYDPHGLPGGILGDLMPRDLPPLAKERVTARELCHLVAERLQWNHPQPKVWVEGRQVDHRFAFSGKLVPLAIDVECVSWFDVHAPAHAASP